MAPAPLSFKTRGGGGGVAYKDRVRPPPRGGGGHKALVVGSVSLWRRLLASCL